MKRIGWIGLLVLLALAACDTTTREARRMVKHAEQLADTLPDSTARLIDSVLRMPASFSERERMDMALLQAEALFGCRDGVHTVSTNTISPLMDDDFFDDHAIISTSPELERAAAYYAGKKQYDKAAHAALYSGFVQQHYNEKEIAMQSFKEAEQYGRFAGDSLAMAQAQYRMGKMLLDDGLKEESLAILQTASLCFGNRIVDKALALNMMGVCYMLQGDVDNAELCLKQGLLEVGKYHSNSSKANLKLLNNYAVLYRLQGEYDKAVNILHQMLVNSNHNENEFFMLNLNLGNVYFDKKVFDSATLYYNRVVELLHSAKTMPNTQLAAYTALSLFAVSQNNDSLALFYREKHEDLLYAVIQQRQEQNIYRIQRQYDYESLQNAMNLKIVHRQRIIMFLSIMAAFVLIAFAVSQIRLARIRKQEADIKACLLNFIQQNKELAQKSERQEKERKDLVQKQKDKEYVWHRLEQQVEEYKSAYQDCASKLSEAMVKEQRIMQKLAVYLDNDKDVALLGSLRQTVLGNCDYWEAMTKIFDKQFPGLRKELELQHPELSDKEQKILILSYIDTSREDTALLLNISIHMVDKLRNTVRKKMAKTTR